MVGREQRSQTVWVCVGCDWTEERDTYKTRQAVIEDMKVKMEKIKSSWFMSWQRGR